VERPIRVYTYPGSVWRQFLVDGLAAGCAIFFLISLQADGPTLALVPALLTGWATIVSFQIRRRHRSRFWLYADRIAWIGAFGIRREALLTSVEGSRPFPAVVADAQGLCFSTPAGFLCFTNQLEGFGDLARRLEDTRKGLPNQRLPPSQLPWTAPKEFMSRDLRIMAALKALLALITLVLAYRSSEMVDVSVILLLLFVALATAATFDIVQGIFARIELVGKELVQFDRWNRRCGSVRLATIHYVGTRVRGLKIDMVIEGEDGAIGVDRNVEGSLELIENAYRVIADRHRAALSQGPAPVPPAPVTTVRT
jgi:hypothetical protein